ncbi:MAG TPA: sensor histidine kinase, partial [Clostridium sp.]|nr:sensor histidine kinase [Clostridium sp.]
MRIKFKRINYNLILGVLVGYILSQIAMFEGYALGIQKNENTGIIDINLSNPALIKLRIAAFCVFVLTVILFNTKKFKKINFNRLNIYLVLVILVSIVVTVQGIIGAVIIIFMIPPNIQNYISSNNFLLANLV